MEDEFWSLARERLRQAGLSLDSGGEAALREIIRFGVRVLAKDRALQDEAKMGTARESLGKLVDEIARVVKERKATRVTSDIVVAALILKFCGIWPFCK